jgi:hypothetical protein
MATDVDHIIAKSKGGTDAYSNLQSLCHRCHSQKTATIDGGFGHAKAAFTKAMIDMESRAMAVGESARAVMIVGLET